MSGKEHVTRRLTRADIPAVRDIDRVAFSSVDQYDTGFYEALPSSPNHDAFVAELHNGTVAGWILADLTTAPLRIRSLSVHPDFRRRGFGMSLIREILRRHPTNIDLLVEPQNTNALLLYQELGFVQADPDPEVPERIRMLRSP